MGLLDNIKDKIGKTTNSSKSVVYNPDCPEIFWGALKESVSTHISGKFSIPKGKAYFTIASENHENTIYAGGYSIKNGIASVGIETYGGDVTKAFVEDMLSKAPQNHPLRTAEIKQGVKNKDKWSWTIKKSADISDVNLLKWYADTLLSIYDFLENQTCSKSSNAENSSGLCKQKHIRVEIQIAEHDYAAFDADESMVGDTYAFNGEDGVENFELYIDGELYDFEDDDPMDVVDSKYSDYKKFDLEAKWDNEDVCSVGYYENMALLTWEFDVDKFEVEKLSINYDCYDVCFAPADYETENHILSLTYDGKTIEPSSVGCSDGDLEQIWSKYDDEDDEEEIVEEVEDEPIDEFSIEITPDTIIDDIYVAFTLKYPHLHLRFLSEPGVMEELVDSSKTVAEIRKILKSKPAVKSGEVQIGGGCVIEDVCNELNKYGIGDTWICCHYGDDLDPEPHGEDRKLAFAESDSVEDAPYTIAGQRKITEDGKIIEETPMCVSEKFGILAATMAGIDGSVEKDEIDMVLTIIQQNSEAFNIAEVRTALLKELKGIQEYDSQSAIVKSIKGDDRELIFQALIMVAVADFKLGQDELGFLGGIADLWEWDWDDCAGMVRMVIENVQEAYGRDVDVEE